MDHSELSTCHQAKGAVEPASWNITNCFTGLILVLGKDIMYTLWTHQQLLQSPLQYLYRHMMPDNTRSILSYHVAFNKLFMFCRHKLLSDSCSRCPWGIDIFKIHSLVFSEAVMLLLILALIIQSCTSDVDSVHFSVQFSSVIYNKTLPFLPSFLSPRLNVKPDLEYL